MVKIRLMRVGATKRPAYRVVIADSRSPRDGRFIEIIGQYDPKTEPSVINIDEDKALAWLLKGAQPSDTALVLLKKTGIWAKHVAARPPKPGQKSKAKKATAKKAAAKKPAAKAAAKS